MKRIALLFFIFVFVSAWNNITYAENTECQGTDLTSSDGNPFSIGYNYQFTTTGTSVTVTFKLLDSKDGLVAYLWNRTSGFQELAMTGSGSQTFSYTLTGQTPGNTITVACKFAYAGGMSVTKDFTYTVGNDCSGSSNPDTEIPTSFTATAGTITSNSVELLLNAVDNSGTIIYNISYGSLHKATSGVSGTSKSYIVTGLEQNTNYSFSVTAQDAAGNNAANNPIVVGATTLENNNTECEGLEVASSDGTPFTAGYNYHFTTVGTDVTATFELLDDQIGVVAYLWDKTSGFHEYPMTNVSGKKFSYTLTGQTPGSAITVACKFAYAGGASITKDFTYTVGEDCSGGTEEPDTQAPASFTATQGNVTFNSVELLLNATDDSGVVVYEITYGATTKTVSGNSGVEKSYIISDLSAGTSYSFSIIAKDVAGNAAPNNPIIVNATTLSRSSECQGDRGHFATPATVKVHFQIIAELTGNVTLKLTPIEAGRTITAAEAQTTKGNYTMVISGDGLSATASLTGLTSGEALGIRFLYQLDNMPGMEMTSETLSLSDANIIYYQVGQDCLTTDMISNESNSTLSIYPNPTKNQFYVNSEKGISELTVSNVQGQVIQVVKALNSTQVSVDINHLPAGSYIVTVQQTDGGKVIRKVLKK